MSIYKETVEREWPERWDNLDRNNNPKKPANERQVGGSYYKDMGIEPWDVVDTWPKEQQIGVYKHGALKYIMRMGTKDESQQEIGKAVHYLEKLLEVLKSD